MAQEKNKWSEAAADGSQLPPPVLPQAQADGTLDVSELTDHIIVRVLRYYNMGPDDQIIAFFNDTPSQPQVVESVAVPFVELYFGKDEFPDGAYKVRYLAFDAVGNPSPASQSAEVTIVHSSSVALPGPVFPDATDGTLSYDTIIAQQGTAVRAVYSAMAVGHVLTFHWTGADYSGNPVPQASYSSDPITVKQSDLQQGFVQARIPAGDILPLGHSGQGRAYYTVTAPDAGVFQSLTSSVVISWAGIEYITLSATSGAPVLTAELPSLAPGNTVTAFGPPGLRTTFSVSRNGIIVGANDRDSGNLNVNLDTKGMARFVVQCHDDSGKAEINLTAMGDLLPGPPASAALAFLPYLKGQNGLQAYQYTTHVVAGQNSYASVYLIVGADRVDTAVVTATVTSGAALINGMHAASRIPLHKDGSATFSLVDEKAEQVQVSIDIDGQPGNPRPISVKFIAFPG